MHTADSSVEEEEDEKTTMQASVDSISKRLEVLANKEDIGTTKKELPQRNWRAESLRCRQGMLDLRSRSRN